MRTLFFPRLSPVSYLHVSCPRVPPCRHCSSVAGAVDLQYDDYSSPGAGAGAGAVARVPLVICHGMLGSRHNWSSIAKQLHRATGRRIGRANNY